MLMSAMTEVVDYFRDTLGLCSLQDYQKIGSVGMAGMTTRELLEKLYNQDYEN